MGPGLLIVAGAGVLALALRNALQNTEGALEAMSGDDLLDNGDGAWSLSLAQFRACFPTLGASRSAQLYEPFLAAAYEAEIATGAQLASYIAQLGYESLDLRALTEFADGTAYEGRSDLGNTEPGDGPRFKGRGAIMITGRANYRAAGKALGIDLEGDPTLAATDAYAFRIAAWYWRKKNLNALADRREFTAMTRAINGWITGLVDRQTRLAEACRVMGIVTVWS
jgi:predicted chitinase